MNKYFKDIQLPETLEYRSDNTHIPLEFYMAAFPIAKNIKIHLGYFSSSAISVLSYPFAQFIYNGGSLSLIINNILSAKDKENLISNTKVNNEDKLVEIFSNLLKLKNELDGGQYFFDCLKYLIKNNRLHIVPVVTKSKTLSHYKNILLVDNDENYLYTEGSANFTAAGILTNGESFNVSRSWGSYAENKRIEKAKKRLNKILNKRHNEYIYLGSEAIENAINKVGKDKNVIELLDDAKDIIKKNIPKNVSESIKRMEKEFYSYVDKIKKEPRFPFPTGPREYQKKAYKNWVSNNYKGIFAMATGTGKTLTALNCLIEEFKKKSIERNIIVVPGEELVRQWYEELKMCNFSNIFLWYSKNNNLNRDIDNIKALKRSIDIAINIVITYSSFKSKRFLNVFNSNFTSFTVIFDEVHNMGAIGVRKIISKCQFKRIIGLSATPLRLWDDDGENDFIEKLFNSYYPNYTYFFSLKDAIGKYLVKYYYNPFFTTFSDDEWEDYLYYTSQIPITDENSKINTKAALKRQLLIDQAENKSNSLFEIINELVHKNDFSLTLVYCPKGKRYKTNDGTDERIIHMLGKKVSLRFPQINIQFFVGETIDRDLLLSDFEKKEVDMLFAIKVLDEGVNVPMAKNAIFLASGKNYREFVQRRGRVLRKHESKEFANIYDIIVLPSLKQYNSNPKVGKRMIVSEFKRIFEFYKTAIYNQTTFVKIEEELKKYGLTQYYIQNIIENEQ